LHPVSNDDDDSDSSRHLPGVDAEVSSMVEVALTPTVKAAGATGPAEISTQEISFAELGMDELLPAEPSSPDVIARRPASYVPNDAFDDAPRAPGASVPPAEKGSSVSFRTLSTLAQLEGVIGHNLSEAAQELTDDDADALEKLMLKGEWPGDEAVTRGSIIVAMRVINPRFRKRTEWTKQAFTSLKNVFLQELARSKIEQLVKLGAKLRKRPPPMPVSLPPQCK